MTHKICRSLFWLLLSAGFVESTASPKKALMRKEARAPIINEVADIQALQPMTNAQDEVLFSFPSIVATISMAFLTLWIYPRAAWSLKSSRKQSAKLCQRILPSVLFQITVVLGLWQAWSCLRYTFHHMPSFPTPGDVPWCLSMSAIFSGVIALHAAMVFYVASADVLSQRKQTVDDLVHTCVTWDHDACDSDCSICYAELSDAQLGAVIAPRCGHGFHKNCLRSWLARNATCPVCRHDLSTDLHSD